MNHTKEEKLYRWKYAEKVSLKYLGKKGCWHQFATIFDPETVWCEVLDDELHMLIDVNTGESCG